MTRNLTSASAFLFVMFIYWLGGGDFERGFMLAYLTTCAAAAAFLTYIAPHWDRIK
jgi:hypothetical protein